MYPPNPGWIARLFDGGKGAVIAGIEYESRSRHTDRDSHGYHTDREHERRQHKHGDERDR